MYIALFFPKAFKTVQIIINIYADGPERWMDRQDGEMEMDRMHRGTGRVEGWRDGPNGRTDIGIAEGSADTRTGRMDRRTEMDRMMD